MFSSKGFNLLSLTNFIRPSSHLHQIRHPARRLISCNSLNSPIEIDHLVNPFNSHSSNNNIHPDQSQPRSVSMPMTESQSTSSRIPEKTKAAVRSFYQRQLPESCLSFTSDEGKSLFRSALASGHMESFFPLASQLVTQHEPSFCGLATLCTILNALGVDPKRVWKHPWRWFEQDMLDCCRPLDSIRQNGITLAEFNCLARCNGLTITSRSPPVSEPQETDQNPDSAYHSGLEEFRREVGKATATSSPLMVVSFCRATLGQTGSGHFSPIAGYSPEHDRVLILDVARFKYPSYWVRLKDLYNSMIPVDPTSGRPRGYTILSYSPFLEKTNCLTCTPNPPSITRITLNKSSWAILYRGLTSVLESAKADSAPIGIRKIIDHISTNLDPPNTIEIRPGLEKEAQEILEQLSSSEELALPDRPQSSDPLLVLFALAILPKHYVDLKFIEPELDYLRSQLTALGECCSLDKSQDDPKIHHCKCHSA